MIKSNITIEKRKYENETNSSNVTQDKSAVKKIWNIFEKVIPHPVYDTFFPKTSVIGKYSLSFDSSSHYKLNEFTTLVIALIEGDKLIKESISNEQLSNQIELKFKYESFKNSSNVDETEENNIVDDNENKWVNIRKEFEFNEVKRICSNNVNVNEKYEAEFKFILPKNLLTTIDSAETEVEEELNNNDVKEEEQIQIKPVEDSSNDNNSNTEKDTSVSIQSNFAIDDHIEDPNSLGLNTVETFDIETDNNETNTYTPGLEHSWQYLTESYLDFSTNQTQNLQIEGESTSQNSVNNDDPNIGDLSDEDFDGPEDIDLENERMEKIESEIEEEQKLESVEVKEVDDLEMKIEGLKSMGFGNRVLNEKLLKFYKGDFDKTLNSLLTLNK